MNKYKNLLLRTLFYLLVLVVGFYEAIWVFNHINAWLGFLLIFLYIIIIILLTKQNKN